MARISRFTFLPFGSSAPSTDIEQFGSKQQTGTPNYTTDPSVIQSLAAWSNGWSAAIVTANHAPYKQDVNAIDFVTFQALCYLGQQGIPEWDANTTYFNSPNPSFVQYNGGYLYISLQDNNLGNAPPIGASNAFWRYVIIPPTLPTQTRLTAASGTYTIPTNPSPAQLRLRFVGGGGGGAAGETSGGHNGTVGQSTVFNGIQAAGGGAGTGQSGSGTPQQGGVGGTGGAGAANVRIPGMGGGPTGTNFQSGWGWGGNSIMGFGGAPAGINSNGNNGQNYGGGGASGQDNDTGGGGGGGGEYVELIINNPAASYAFTVAQSVPGGVGVFNGGSGAPGIIVIDEFYF